MTGTTDHKQDIADAVKKLETYKFDTSKYIVIHKKKGKKHAGKH